MDMYINSNLPGVGLIMSECAGPIDLGGEGVTVDVCMGMNDIVKTSYILHQGQLLSHKPVVG